MRISKFRKIQSVARNACAAALLALSVFAFASPAAAQNNTEAIAGAARIAQVNAFLPDKYSVTETEALPIDGVWMISTIGKKIRIERGRAYAVDPWLHMFVLKVEPDMVVLRNFQRTGAGQYAAEDLPLLGPATFQLQPDCNLSVTVKGALGPASYVLIKREADDPAALEAEIAALNGNAVSPPPSAAPAPAPGGANPLADCKQLGVDQATGDVVCMD